VWQPIHVDVKREADPCTTTLLVEVVRSLIELRNIDTGSTKSFARTVRTVKLENTIATVLRPVNTWKSPSSYCGVDPVTVINTNAFSYVRIVFRVRL
jgi:hypothetical protein